MEDFKDDIRKAVEVLQNGGVIIYPTDTIWGIGCDATNAEAVKRIYEIKQREDSKSMLVLLNNVGRIQSYVDDVPDVALDLVELAVKPTTVIYDKAKNLAVNLIAADGSVGLRVTSEEFSSALLQRFKKPIVSTSANISGAPSPQKFDDISEELLEKVDYVVKYRQEETANPSPSSIIKIGTGGVVQVIRE